MPSADIFFDLLLTRMAEQNNETANLEISITPEGNQLVITPLREALCHALSQEESTWMPELRLEIAHSLAHLPDKSCAKQQIADSIRSWMALRGMEAVQYPDETNIPLDALSTQMAGGLLTMSEHEYLAKLDDCLSAVYA
jgi:glutaredoxin 2